MSIIERAYQLARSGECQDIKELERRLRAEHFDGVLQHLNSPSLRKDLGALMRAAQNPPQRRDAAE